MKVFHLLKTSTGATWALRQIRELIRLGVEVHVALPGRGPLVGAYSAVGAIEHLMQPALPIREPWKVLDLIHQIRGLVEKIRPDVIHSHFVTTTMSMRLSLGRNHPISRVFQVPGPLHLEHPFFRSAEIGLSGKSDYWIGSCQWTCDKYRSAGVKANRVFLAYYGTDLLSFSSNTRGNLRSSLKLQSNARVVGMVAYMYAPKRYLGQCRGIKGHEDLIDAMAIVRQHIPEAVVVFVGGPWGDASQYEEHIHQYASKHIGKAAYFLGHRTDVPKLYPEMDVAVHPSHSENLGGAAESLMAGVPTIATNVGGFPDIICNGLTGWLVPPKSPTELAAAILEALENRDVAARRAQEGKARVIKMVDVKHTAKKVFDIYSTILASA